MLKRVGVDSLDELIDKTVPAAIRDRTPLANLHVTLLDKLGAPVERIGDSTGPLPTLLGGPGADRLSEI